MRRRRSPAAAALLAALQAGCATVETKRAVLDAAPDGIRIYPPKVCLLVDTAANTTVIAYFPDFARAYDVKPRTLLSRQELRVELEAGQLESFMSNQDTTAFPSLLAEAAEVAAAAGAGVSAGAPLKGSFGFSDGVHCMGDDGRFAR